MLPLKAASSSLVLDASPSLVTSPGCLSSILSCVSVCCWDNTLNISRLPNVTTNVLSEKQMIPTSLRRPLSISVFFFPPFAAGPAAFPLFSFFFFLLFGPLPNYLTEDEVAPTIPPNPTPRVALLLKDPDE